jgi:hypothetical protein
MRRSVRHAPAQLKEPLMNVMAWIVASVFLGLLSPLLACAALAQAAWAAMRERMTR